MSFGTSGFGVSSWGGGQPSVNGIVFIAKVQYITPTYLRLDLNTQVIVNALYLNVINYRITLRSDSPVPGIPVSVVRIIPPTQDVLVADYVYLETTQHTDGAFYDARLEPLNTLDGGISFNGSTQAYATRVTKTMKMLKSLPSHFDKRVDSLLHALVSAISIEDDTLGGSRNDEFATTV